MEKIFSILQTGDILPFNELLRQVLNDKGMSYQELAEKLQITVEEVEAYDDYKSAPSVEILKKLSSILWVPYPILRICAGYNCVCVYPDFYLPNDIKVRLRNLSGDKIGLSTLPERIYNDPSILPRLLEALN